MSVNSSTTWTVPSWDRTAIFSTFLPARMLLALLITYLSLVKVLRYRRMKSIQKTFSAYATRCSFNSLSFVDAQHIIQHLSQYEFPFTFKSATQFALFRTYGIPTISSLLVNTSLFSAPETASKRYADTGVLILDFIVGDWGSPRWVQGLSRINCIHEQYRKAGKISNPDMLYTLSLFAREPIKWTAHYEWRTLTDLERCAIGVFWKGIGDGMQISYSGLAANDDGTWRDGLHWLEAVTEWAEAYEVAHMIPSPSNAEVAEQTTAILLWSIPSALKPLGKHAVSALLDSRLRNSMKYPVPPAAVTFLVHALLQIRRLLLRHAALPRPEFLAQRDVTHEPDKDGRYFMLTWDSLPFYVKPTAWNRWLGPRAWISRARGLPLPGDGGNKFHPQGYVAVDCGPAYGKGSQKEMEEMVGRIGGLKCPMAFVG